MKSAPVTLALGGFPVLCTRGEELQHRLHMHLRAGDQMAVFFANTNFVVRCQGLQPAMAEGCLIINDGVGVDIATWLVHRKRFPQNLNGSDFVPGFLRELGRDARVFLFGGKPGIAQRAAQALREDFAVPVVGTSDGYSQASDNEGLVERINASGATVLLVAMGNPLQEQWILQHRNQLEARLLIGVGALLDFLAGDKPRAPHWVRRLRLEWLYHLTLEPARLARRYTLDIAVFLALCLRRGKRVSEG